MNSAHDFLGLLAELFTWIGLVVGGLCLVALLITRSASARWIETDAIVVEEKGGVLRWMSGDGLHECSLTPSQREELQHVEGLRVYYRPGQPERIRFERTGHGEKTARLLTWLMLGLGGGGAVGSIVLLFVEA
ncbi:hypothetical protein [Glaciibacter psychrotolerans]|uniref:DUF3592 domain-containing protein n=1 Tax=Glaciibacter psychrotolerans TaxID=670054 RepID=A0A7Z0EII0_9MICO|nr:hypothetical protein [Leifsonia psychrotolerans]NYJ21479.1 hypothetical protein [Leifsonia psychrotolerans]